MSLTPNPTSSFSTDRKSTSSISGRSSISVAPPLQPDTTHPNSPLEAFTSVTKLSAPDHLAVCRAIGAISDSEDHTLAHIKSCLWPPRGLPPGLYRDVVRARTISQYQYYLCSLFFNLSLVMQLLLGAAVTGISSSFSSGSALITFLAAANTVIAGLLALMHNSGLPDRYKKDWSEFENVEMWLGEVVRGKVVREGMNREQLIEYGFGMYRRAKSVVASNKPAAYVSSASASTAVSKGE